MLGSLNMDEQFPFLVTQTRRERAGVNVKGNQPPLQEPPLHPRAFPSHDGQEPSQGGTELPYLFNSFTFKKDCFLRASPLVYENISYSLLGP